MKKHVKEAIKSVVNPRYGAHLARRHLKRRAINQLRANTYKKWFEATKLDSAQYSDQQKRAKNFKLKPLISVIIPTYNTNPQHLAECLESVIAQTYDNWEICISDDASTNAETLGVIKNYSETYPNIYATFNTKNAHIAVSSNVALAMARGEYVSLLDHDDVITPDALYEACRVINEQPETDLIYTDEDKIDEQGEHIEPFFKPDWSPDFLNSCNVITHFATIRKDIIDAVEGFTPGTQGAQDWDLFLKITQKTDKVQHIPKILYHWRKSETSTAKNSKSKPYAYINQRKVLRKSVIDRKEAASVEAHPAMGFWRKRYDILSSPLVSIIVPTKDCYDVMTQCIDSVLERTTYPYFEVILVDTGSTDSRVFEYYKKLETGIDRVKVVTYGKKEFNFSAACNLGARHANGEYLLFLNNDTEVISGNWIQSLLEHAQRPNVGMVGPRLLFPDKTIQHAGIVLSDRDIAFHPFYAQDPLMDIFTYIYISNIRNVSAVTAACSMVAKKKFDHVGGFEEQLRVTYNDVDLNLKLLDAGYTNIYTPYAELYHHESVSVGRIATDKRNQDEYKAAYAFMKDKWGVYLKRDRYYNDNFEQFGPGYVLPALNASHR